MGLTDTPIGAIPFKPTAALTVALLATSFASAAPQEIAGRVVLAGWQEPVAGARVHLLVDDSLPAGASETDEEGRFSFKGLAAGSYRLRAAYDTLVSSLAGPFDVGGQARPATVELTLPSELYRLASSCARDAGQPGTGVLAGIAYDDATTTPIPAARVTVDWIGPGGSDNHAEGATDGAGRFVFCDVAASTPLRVRAEALGGARADQDDVRVRPGALARLDLPVALTEASEVRVLSRSASRTDSLATLLGRLTDAQTEEPIGGAVVGVAGFELSALTGDDGQFRIGNVPPGERRFEVTRLGYDWESQPLPVAAGATMVVELRARPSAVRLEAVVVRASTSASRLARGSTHAQRLLAGARLRAAEERATSFLEVIRDFPSLQMRQGRFETAEGVEHGTCIESTRALRRYAVPEQNTSLPWCEMIAIVIDGITTVRGAEMANLLRLNHIESIELLPPMGALQYGERAAVNGAIVIWTLGRGPHADPARRDLSRPRGGRPR